MGTRDLILEEALKLFSERGIKETTVRDIARAVGITEGAIYRHFESKDQIVYELFETHSGALYDRVKRAIEKAKDPKDKFISAVESFLDFAFKNPDAFRYLNLFHYLRGKEVRKFPKIPFQLLKALVEELREEGFLKVEPELALAVLTGTLERVFLYKEMGMLKGRKKELRTKTAQLLWNILTGGDHG